MESTRIGHDRRMKGFEVITSDDHTVGRVVEVRPEHLIVERGTLRKSRHALPKAFAHPRDDRRVVRVTVSRDLVADSPKLEGDSFDEQEVARYYGLAGGYEQPATAGEGEVGSQDPARPSTVEGARHGVEPPDKERAEVRTGKNPTDEPAVRERLRVDR